MEQHQEMMRRTSTTRHQAALRSVQKPSTKPWRAGTGLAPTPPRPRVYRVDPREFRDLVQRLTGAPAVAGQQHLVAQPVPVRVGGGSEETGHMYAYASAAPWSSFPFMAPASAMHPGLDGQQLI